MPHAAVIAASVTVGAAAIVGAAVAYEMYREGKGEEPLLDSMRAGWNEFRNDVRRGLWDFRERMDGNNVENAQDEHDTVRQSTSLRRRLERNTGAEDEAEMRAVQQELDDFEMNDITAARASGRRTTNDNDMPNSHVRQRRQLHGSRALLDEDEEIHSTLHSRLVDLSTADDANLDAATTQDSAMASKHISPASSHASTSIKSRALSPSELARPANELSDMAVQSSASPSNRSQTVQRTITSDDEDDDWLSRASSASPSTNFVHLQQADDGNTSDAWTQLDESLPGTPTSGSSWNAVQHRS